MGRHQRRVRAVGHRGLLTAATRGGDHGPMTVFGAVVVAVAIVAAWRFAIAKNGKGTAPGRLVALLIAAIVIWMFVAVNNPAAGAKAAAFTAAGTSTLVTGIGHFIADL